MVAQLREAAIQAASRATGAGTADAMVQRRRRSGRPAALARWQARLADYPEELARARIEDAALTWGGFAAGGLLTIARPGERLARLERMLDDASRVLRSSMRSTGSGRRRRSASRRARRRSRSSRNGSRSGSRGLTEPDPRRALRMMRRCRFETAWSRRTARTCRARGRWLPRVIDILRSGRNANRDSLRCASVLSPEGEPDSRQKNVPPSTTRPRCARPRSVTIRPRGVRCRKPSWSRNGS